MFAHLSFILIQGRAALMELSRFGTRASPADAEALKLKIHEELHDNRVKNKDRFVGCHPITLTLNNVHLLLKDDFLVCEKSDGVRALLFITNYMEKTRGYFHDRKNDFYELDIDFPFINTVLLDGEVFLEDASINTYAIFDCLIYEGVPQITKNLYKRLGYAQMFTDAMKTTTRTKKRAVDSEGRKRVPIESNTLAIDFYVKEMLKSYGFWEIHKKIPELRHGNDGLIFTPVDEPYSLGKRGTILKWKPAYLNTIDFKMIKFCGAESVYELVCTGKRGKDVVFDYFFGDGEEDMNGKIAEFLYDTEGHYLDMDDLTLKKGGWKLYKVRTDKDSPNNITVVCNILESLEDDLSIERLSTFYSTMRENSKNREKTRKEVIS